MNQGLITEQTNAINNEITRAMVRDWFVYCQCAALAARIVKINTAC